MMPVARALARLRIGPLDIYAKQRNCEYCFVDPFSASQEGIQLTEGELMAIRKKWHSFSEWEEWILHPGLQIIENSVGTGAEAKFYTGREAALAAAFLDSQNSEEVEGVCGHYLLSYLYHSHSI